MCRMIDVFDALGDPTRRALLDKLFGARGLTLAELCEGQSMSRQGVAKHLSILEESGLVTAHRDGRFKRHYLNPVPLTQIVHRWVGKFEDARIEALSDFQQDCEQRAAQQEKNYAAG